MRKILHNFSKGDNYNGAIFGAIKQIFQNEDPKIIEKAKEAEQKEM